MRLQVVSDLHLEVDPSFRLPSTAADLLLLDGDIAPGTAGLAAFAGSDIPIIYVPGNHEFYGFELEAMRGTLRDYATDAGIHLLDRSQLVLEGVRFLGTTLWTDFRLDGEERLPLAFSQSLRNVLDFRKIHLRDRLLSPQDTVDFFQAEAGWLQARLEEPFAGPTVVITHHAPHPLSVHARWAGNPCNPAFVSDLTPLMGKAAFWIHGHTHDSFDYRVAGTRVICNPKGYRNENSAFDAALTVEI